LQGFEVTIENNTISIYFSDPNIPIIHQPDFSF